MDYSIFSVQELRNLRDKHNSLYYSGIESKECIPDSEFDKIILALKAKEAPFDVTEQTTDTVNIDKNDATDRDRIMRIHGAPMLSLDTVTDYTIDGFLSFDRRVRNILEVPDETPISYVTEPKYDGLGLSLKYVAGELTAITLRGDGMSGEDVTRAIPRFNPAYLPTKIHPDFSGEIRGEAMMTLSNFREFNERLEAMGLPRRKNPRNTAAGLVRTYEPPIPDEEIGLIFFGYSIPVSSKEFNRQSAVLQWLKMQGFKLAEGLEPLIYTYPNGDITPYEYHERAASAKLDIEMDGVVYKVNEMGLQKLLGFRNREPRWASAHKFMPKCVLTRMEGLSITVGRTGVLTPVASLSPVEVGGVTVSSAILENVFHIRRLGLRIGDTVELVRGGDVIPKIVSARPNRQGYVPNIRMPKHCPFCGSNIIRKKGMIESHCPNILCNGRKLETLKHFVSRNCMNIVGLGDKTVTELFAKGLVRDPIDLYKLKLEQIPNVKGNTKIMRSIDVSRDRRDWMVLASIGIPGLGHDTAKKICNEIRLSQLSELSFEGLSLLGDRIGEPAAISSLVEVMMYPEAASKMYALIDELKNTMEYTVGRISDVKGVICLTGSFGTEPGSRRQDLEEEFELKGWKISNKVTMTTKYLIIGARPTVEKIHKANELGTMILNLNDFRKSVEV